MVKTRNYLTVILIAVATFFVLCFLCIGFASLQDELSADGTVKVVKQSAVLSKRKFRDALKRKESVGQIFVGNFADLQDAGLSSSDLNFVADVSDPDKGMGNSVGLYTNEFGNIAYVLAIADAAVTFPEDSSYVFAWYLPGENGSVEYKDGVDVVECLGKVTLIDFGSTDFGRVDMNDVMSMYRMFFHCEKLTSIALPDDITLVAQAMFRGCKELESVKISDNTTRIGSVAFGDCYKLKRINDSPSSAEASCNIPQSVTSIGQGAFIWCSVVEKIVLPDKIAVIEPETFEGCYLLKNMTIPQDVTSIGNSAFLGCYDVGFSTLAIPDSVTSIGEGAFSGCSGLTSVTMGSGLKTIGKSAFDGCWRLPEITVPNGVTSMGADAFGGCPIATATIPATAAKFVHAIVNVDDNFNYHLTNVTVTAGEIEAEAFVMCRGIVSVTLQNGVTDIGTNAFNGCYNITSVTISGGVKSIGEGAFGGCGITNVTIPGSVESIGKNAFLSCGKLTELTLESGVQTIGEYAFSGCGNLDHMTLHAGLTNIGDYAFNGCWQLKYIDFYGTSAQWTAIVKGTSWDGGWAYDSKVNYK